MPEPPPRPDLRDLPAGGVLGGDDAGRPSVTWSWWEGVLAYVVVGLVLAQTLVGGALVVIFGLDVTASVPDSPVIALTLVVDLVTVAGLVGWLQWRHPGWLRALWVPAKGARGREFGIGYGLGFLLYLAVLGVGLVLTAVFSAIFGEQVVPPEQLSSNLTTIGQAAAVLLAIVVAPVTEELFFRGILFRSVRDRWGFWPGAISSSLLFGLAHYVPSPWHDAVLLQSIMVFTGLGLCLIYERRGSFLANVAAHMAFNTVGLVSIFLIG